MPKVEARSQEATPAEAKKADHLGDPLLQFQGGPGGQDLKDTAAEGIAGSGSRIPFFDTIQASFGGYDVSGISAHTDGHAKQANQDMGSNAYAMGNDVAFAGSPSLHTAAHEAAHSKQQASGPMLEGGVGVAGDVYEQHADKVADAVVRGESAEPVLDAMPGAGPGVQMKALQFEGDPKDPQKAGRGLVIGSAGATEGAYDASFTPALMEKMKENPSMDLDTALHEMAGGSLHVRNSPEETNDAGLHHPTIVAFGRARQGGGWFTKAKKQAVLVGNQNYDNVKIEDLKTSKGETESFSTLLEGRGYTTTKKINQTSGPMTQAYKGLVDDAKQGDQLVAYFAGHGTREGLAGVATDGKKKGATDLMGYSKVPDMVNTATSKGANIRFVMDACHSGEAAQLVRTEQIGKLAKQGKGQTATVVHKALSELQFYREDLDDILHDRGVDRKQARFAMRRHQKAHPGDGAPSEQIAAWQAKLDQLNEAVKAFEAKAEEDAKNTWKKYHDAMVWVAQVADGFLGAKLAKPGAQVITDFETLGAQLNEIDVLSNRLLKWGQDVAAEEAASAKG